MFQESSALMEAAHGGSLMKPLKMPPPPRHVPRLEPHNASGPQEPPLPSLQASPKDELLRFTS